MINSGVVVGSSVYQRAMQIRTAARKAYVEADDSMKLRRALHHRTRPERGPFNIGDRAYFWRRTAGSRFEHWRGPGTVIGKYKGESKVWVAYGTRVLRCSPEQLRKPTTLEQDAIDKVPESLTALKTKLGSEGSSVYVDISAEGRPPDGPEPQAEQNESGQGEVNGGDGQGLAGGAGQ